MLSICVVASKSAALLDVLLKASPRLSPSLRVRSMIVSIIASLGGSVDWKQHCAPNLSIDFISELESSCTRRGRGAGEQGARRGWTVGVEGVRRVCGGVWC